jgi:hypothetical protein
MSFGTNDHIAQPPPTTDRIFISIREAHFHALNHRIRDLESALLEIQRLILHNHQIWVENGRPEASHPGPIIAAIVQTIQRVAK